MSRIFFKIIIIMIILNDINWRQSQGESDCTNIHDTHERGNAKYRPKSCVRDGNDKPQWVKQSFIYAQGHRS